MTIYLDNNSTTACAPEVIDAMLPFLAGIHGNPSSPHIMGREAARAVARAREQIGKCVDVDAADILCTGSATEANNLAILGMAQSAGARRKVIVSAVEHKSVLEPCQALTRLGFQIFTLPVDGEGTVRVDIARELIDQNTLLVAVQGANNEVGTIQPVSTIAEIAHRHGALMHCDASQLLGKVPVSVCSLGADTLAFSAHKAYGPKGVGVLVVTQSVLARLGPVLYGGGQEHGLRPGTENVSGIVGMGEACRLCQASGVDDGHRIESLRSVMEHDLCQCTSGVSVIGSRGLRVPGTSSIHIRGCPSDLMIARTPRVCMGTGSACNSGAYSPSHVLRAVGLSDDDARSTLRLSIGRYSTRPEIDEAVRQLSHSVAAIRGTTV